MQITKKCKSHVKRKTHFEKNTKHRASWKIIALALYLTFILLSTIAFTADRSIVPNMKSSYEYHLTYTKDGLQSHYYVERVDTSELGRIDLVYKTASNSLIVDAKNIKVLHIYCRSMYEDECRDVFGIDPDDDTNYYKWYFIEKNHLNVKVDTDHEFKELSFIDTPIPYNVSVNTREWWLTGINYTYKNDGIVLTKVPSGHTNVDIYFKSNNLNSPVAQLTVSKTIVGVGETITFNASSSYDPDGEIISYVWDFGEGAYKIGETTEHNFRKEGDYKVILTVKDNDYLIDRAYQDIFVVKRVMSISKTVDKPIATPGSILTYTITSTINSSWPEGLKDILITDELPYYLEYVDSTPKAELTGRTLTWKLNSATSTDDLPVITFQALIDKSAENNTIISNYAILDYKGTNNQDFPSEFTNLVNTKINTGSILAPRILRPVPDVKLKEDDPPFDLWLSAYEYDLQDSVYNLKWYITGENKSLYILSGEYSNNDVITITPIPNMYGNSLVTLWLVDSDGYSANQPLWINITPVNDKPIFSDPPDLIVHHSQDYTFNYEPYVYDIDTSIENLQIFASERNGSRQSVQSTTESEYIQIDGLKVTYNFPKNYVDRQIFVSLIIFDGDGSDGKTIQINVTNDYTPILRNDLPDIWLDEGETKLNVFDLDDYFDDPDQDSLFYSYGETHITVQINDDHTVDISAPLNWHGVDTVTFRARDPIGALAEDTILVTVSPVNDPPVITGVPDTFVIHYDADYCFDLTPYITDEDNTLDELFLILSDEHIRTDPSNHLRIIMNYPEVMLHLEIPVILMVSDGIDTGFQIVSVKVTDKWPPEITEELPDISFYEDESVFNVFNLDEYFSDRDSKTLYYSYGNKYVNVIINSNATVDFSASQDWFGVETVTFRATDNSLAFVESAITVTVHPVNDPPVLWPLPNQYKSVKQLWKFDLTEYVFDVDNNITELTIEVESIKLDVMVSGRELVLYSDRPLLEQIMITISDGENTISGTMTVEVKETQSKSEGTDFLMSILWLLIIIIITIITLTGYATYKKYIGNYRVEEVFWIHNTGILLTHEASEKADDHAQNTNLRADDDIVSGILTSILDFTQDAFSEKKKENIWVIKEIQMKGKNILVERGKHTFLATIFSGKSGKKLYRESRIVLQSAEFRFNYDLSNWKCRTNRYDTARDIIRSILPVKNNDNSLNSRFFRK